MTTRLKLTYVATLAALLGLGLTIIAATQAIGQNQPDRAEKKTPAQGATPQEPGTRETPATRDTKSSPGAQESRRTEGGQPSRAKQAAPGSEDQSQRADEQRTDQQRTDEQRADQQRTPQQQRDTGDRSRDAKATRRTDLGLQLQAQDERLHVKSLRENSVFARAGLRQGDQIVSVDGRTFTTEAELNSFLAERHGRIPVVVMRDGQRQTIHVNMAQDQAGEGESKGALGIWFYGYDRGAWVMDVVPDSPAHHAGLRRGDWVVSFNGKEWDNWEQFVSEVQETEPGQSAEVEIARGDGEPSKMNVRLGDQSQVFASAQEPRIAAEGYPRYQRFEQGRRFQEGYEPTPGRLMRGGQRAARPDLESMSRIEELERRIQQLEREVAALRGQQPSERQQRSDNESGAGAAEH